MDETTGDAMDQAIEREQAAETLRAVEGLRRRTLGVVSKMSPFPPLVFGLAALMATPFTWFSFRSRFIVERIDGSFASFGPVAERSPIATLAAVGIATLAAIIVTEIYYRRQPVHAAGRQRRISTAEAILLAAAIIVLGPMIVGLLFSFAFSISGTSMVAFAALTIAALVMGRRLKNGALALAGGFGLLAAGLSTFIYADHWETVGTGLYAALFLLSAFLVRYLKRDAA